MRLVAARTQQSCLHNQGTWSCTLLLPPPAPGKADEMITPLASLWTFCLQELQSEAYLQFEGQKKSEPAFEGSQGLGLLG